MKVLTSLLLLAPAFALDLILDSITCDEALPYYATDFDMKCDGQTRCTFGKDAVIYGELVYNGTENAGVVDSVVYAESGLQFMTLEYKLFEDLPLNMCGKWVLGIEEDAEEEEAADDAERRRLADEEAAGDDAAAFDDDYVRDDNCPADGLYAFQVGYTLPAADDVTSWLATGWAGSGEISIFAEKGNSATLVGYCTLKFSTAVTASSSGSMNPPSALVASLIAVAVVLGIVLLCIYCTCCRSKKTSAAAKNKAAGGGGKYHDDDPIDMARSRSDVDSYQAMDEQAASTKKPWASPF